MRDIVKTGVKCDMCDWKKLVQWEEIPKWHGVKCPECGKCVIIDDNDMRTFAIISGVAKIQEIEDPENKKEKVPVEIDTSSLRKPRIGQN